MNKKLLLLVALTLGLAVFGACQKETAPPEATTTEIAGTTSPSDVSPMAAQAWMDDVTLGHELGADGAIAAGKTGDDFAPGDSIHLAVETSDAPAGSAVKVVWYGPGEKIIAEEQKSVVAGQKYLNFSATDTKGWAKGDYRAELWVGDEKANTQQFQIVDRAKARK